MKIISSQYRGNPSIARLIPLISSTFDGTVPLHFYGELVKTAEGRAILEDKGHFYAFAEFIRTHGLESKNLETMMKLKSVLWAVVSR